MKKKALFISGGWEGHEPIETSEYISVNKLPNLILKVRSLMILKL